MEHRFRVTVTDELILCERPDGTTESIGWRDLRGVVIETTDRGPFGADVFWLLAGEKSGCIIPMGAQGEKDLLSKLKELPHFDFSAMIMAMGSTENERFVVWHHGW